MFFLLLILSFEFRTYRRFVHVLPQDTQKAFGTDSITGGGYVRLPLTASWINLSKNNLLILKGDTVFYFDPFLLFITHKETVPLRNVLKIYTDEKGNLIYLTSHGAYYKDGRKAKYRIFSDTINIVFGKFCNFKYRSPACFKGHMFYIKDKRVYMNVKIDTMATRLISYTASELSSYVAKDTVYTKTGCVIAHGRLIRKGLPEGVAFKKEDTLFVYNLKDTVYVLLVPAFKIIGTRSKNNTPFRDLFSDFDGNVYFKGRKIYKDRYFVSTTLLDIDKDGNLEIILGRPDGNFAVLKKISGIYVEWMSYSPPPSLYKRYISHGLPMFYRVKIEESPFAAFVDTVNPLYRDEIIYVIQHASPEFNDSLLHVGFSYLFDNVFDIYLAARRLKYVSLAELKDGKTTLVLNKKDTIPPGIYYKFVVFPRILYEFPEKTLFRTFFMNDHMYGKSVVEVVEKDTIVMDAVKHLYSWAKSFMHFGYMTNDLSPVVIYRKAYGSCGEYSILGAALLKTVLIPAYVAVDMGEDHQWNEFYNGKRWIHFDLTQEPGKAIDNPYASSEGMGNKEVSIVLGVVPEGGFFPITHHGYTSTGRINVRVVDINDNPVGFALVILVSHWANRQSISYFRLTDRNGRVFFDAGFEKNGYSIYVYSPFGRGGVGNFMVEEDSFVDLTVKVGGRVGDKHLKIKNVEGRALLFYRNFRTGEIMPIVDSAYLYEQNGMLKNPYAIGIIEFVKEDTLYAEDRPPSIRVEIARDSLENGMPLVYKVEAEDNLGIKSIEAILEGPVWKRFRLWKRQGVDTLYFNQDTVVPPGRYKLIFQAIDFAAKKDSSVKFITILPGERFLNQMIKQDPIDGTEGSWNYIFTTRDTLPFIFIQTTGITPGMDIDLFFKKHNKIIAKSISPSASETIYLHPVLPGTYTVTVKGWHVPLKRGLFNILIEK